jgi:hypothetical protein
MNLTRILLLTLAGCAGSAKGPTTEVSRYVRVTPQGTSLECSMAIIRTQTGWTITSVTGKLTVDARYDAADRLLDAQAAFRGGPAARAEVSGDRARITAPGRENEEVEVPPGVIVTSAPDWTDTFRICRLWNRARAGRQEFPGLWIHPVQPTRRLTFSAEGIRRDGFEHGGRRRELDVLTIRLRGDSLYRAWVDPAGRMIKLVSLPAKQGSTVLVLEGFEDTAAALADD